MATDHNCHNVAIKLKMHALQSHFVLWGTTSHNALPAAEKFMFLILKELCNATSLFNRD